MQVRARTQSINTHPDRNYNYNTALIFSNDSGQMYVILVNEYWNFKDVHIARWLFFGLLELSI